MRHDQHTSICEGYYLVASSLFLVMMQVKPTD
jgi:hypothetical protein